MEDRAEALELVRRIRVRFPEEASATDQWLIERSWDPHDVTHIWVEAFADRTSDAIRAKDVRTVREHTDFMSEEYRRGSEQVRQLVDVAYAENLMWDLDSADKVWAWGHISQAVRQLYQDMWGVPQL